MSHSLLHFALQWSAAAGTRSTTGLYSCPKSSQTAQWRAPSLARSWQDPGNGQKARVEKALFPEMVSMVSEMLHPHSEGKQPQSVNVRALGRQARCWKPSPHFVGFALQSKGGILSKACDYIQELRQSNHRLSEELQGLDQLQLDNDVLRQQVRLIPGWPPWQPCSH